MNSTNLTGRLVYEPELKRTQSGTAYTSNRIAVSRNDKNKTTDFFNIKAWNGSAEFMTKYFHKGDPIEITGKLQTESYEKKDGTKVNEVVIFVTEIGFTLSKNEKAAAPSEPVRTAPVEIDDADLPFQI